MRKRVKIAYHLFPRMIKNDENFAIIVSSEKNLYLKKHWFQVFLENV